MKKIFTLFLTMCTIVACTQFEEPTAETKRSTPQTRSGGNTPTFDTLPNPFTMDVMQGIYDDFNGNRILQPTDLYVRILPQDTLQMHWLWYESNLELFDYPLDLDIPEGGEYVDPTIPEGEPGWLYTTVPPDYVFPTGYVYEVLEECYIPEDGETVDVPGTRAGEGSPVEVTRLALERLGYELAPDTPQTRASAAKPRGRIMVYDNTPGVDSLVPLKEVKVRTHFIVWWKSAYTNENGEYTIEGMKVACKVHYAVVYHNKKDFKIWGGTGALSPVIHKMGWHYTQNEYNENIGVGRNCWYWSVVNNAAYDYYEMCEDNKISKPPGDLKIDVQRTGENNCAPMLRRIQIAGALTNDNWAAYVTWATGLMPGLLFTDLFKWAMPDLYLGLLNHDTYRSIYQTANHELSHASHFSQVGVDYWERYVSHIVSKFGYGDGSGANAGICQVGEMWGYAMEAIQGSEKYNRARLDDVYYNTSYYTRGDVDDFFHRPGGETTNGWIHPDPIWALITRGVLTKKEVFDCLTSDVDTRAKLINKMCSKYSDKYNRQNE